MIIITSNKVFTSSHTEYIIADSTYVFQEGIKFIFCDGKVITTIIIERIKQGYTELQAREDIQVKIYYSNGAVGWIGMNDCIVYTYSDN